MDDVKPKHPGGRPTIFTQELADRICALVAEGKSFRRIRDEEKGMPDLATIFNWLRTNDKFLEQYTRAKEQASEALADEILDIADNGTNDWVEIQKGKGNFVPIIDREHVERSKLRIESRKWLLAKLKPKKYGEKIDHTTNGKDLPTPILATITNVPSDNSNAEDSAPTEADTSHTGGNVGEQDDQRPPLLDSLGANG